MIWTTEFNYEKIVMRRKGNHQIISDEQEIQLLCMYRGSVAVNSFYNNHCKRQGECVVKTLLHNVYLVFIAAVFISL